LLEDLQVLASGGGPHPRVYWRRFPLTPLAPLLFVLGATAPALREEPFTLSQSAEVTARVTANCARCAWGERGREAALLVLEVDGHYSQHLALVRGAGPADYSVFLGRLGPGPHRVKITLDRRATAKAVGEVSVGSVTVQASLATGVEATALACAPIVYARRGTVKRWSDFPLLTWYETEPTTRGRRIRYSVIFTNEDGGTPIDRLMATWGRTTDVEFAYAVELDPDGRVLEETYQSEHHKLIPFGGRREGRHPLLFVVTENNMFGDHGRSRVRFAQAPQAFSLADRSREAVMDANPWTYRVSAEEARREGRVAENAGPGSGLIPDPCRFAYLEACAPAQDATLAFSLGAAGPDGGLAWHASDAGGPRYRVSRAPHNFPNGCFQAAVALPAGIEVSAIRALRVQAFTRPAAKGEAPLPAGTGRARLVRVNRLFMLGPDDQPGPNLFSWTGEVPLAGEGPPHELEIGAPPRE
jgi:hypothetical protein